MPHNSRINIISLQDSQLGRNLRLVIFLIQSGISSRKEVKIHNKISSLGLSDPIPSTKHHLLKISQTVKMLSPAEGQVIKQVS